MRVADCSGRDHEATAGARLARIEWLRSIMSGEGVAVAQSSPRGS